MNVVEESLAVIRQNLTNPRFIVLNGELRSNGFSKKALGYQSGTIPTDSDLAGAVAAERCIAVETGEFFTLDFDPCDSRVDPVKWLSENAWRLERLGTIVVESPRHGFHVWAASTSDTIDFDRLTDWLWVVEECGIFPDTIHFRGKNCSDYAIVPGSPGYSFLGKCRTIRRL